MTHETEQLSPAYIAGVVDADGSISVVKRKSPNTRGGFFYVAILQITWIDNMKSRRVFDSLKSQYGGTYHVINRPDGGAQVIKYGLMSKNLLRLLTDIVPHLQLKPTQAVLAMQMLGLRKVWGPGGKPASVWQEEDLIYETFKGLNRKNGHDMRLVVACDVDDTLIDVNNQPIQRVLNVIVALAPFVKLVVWSGGGKEYAQHWGTQLGLPQDTLYMAKNKFLQPDIAFDDSEFMTKYVDLLIHVESPTHKCICEFLNESERHECPAYQHALQ